MSFRLIVINTNLVGEVGIEPTLTALSRQCLRVYKARPEANISNSPVLNLLK